MSLASPLLGSILHHFHDWSLKAPDCELGYVRTLRGAPPELQNGPPKGCFLRADRQILETSNHWDQAKDVHFVSDIIFFGPTEAAVAFTQLATELDRLMPWRDGMWKATGWYEFLFEIASRLGGFGAVTVAPTTWEGEEVRWLTSEDSEPDHVFGYLHNSPFMASEFALTALMHGYGNGSDNSRGNGVSVTKVSQRKSVSRDEREKEIQAYVRKKLSAGVEPSKITLRAIHLGTGISTGYISQWSRTWRGIMKVKKQEKASPSRSKPLSPLDQLILEQEADQRSEGSSWKRAHK